MDLISSSILGPICERVIDAALEEYTLVRGVKEEIKNLEFTVSLIKAMLQDAERKQAADVRISIWLQSLKQILFDAEDVLDEIATDEALRRMSDVAGGTRAVTTSKRAAKVLMLKKMGIEELPMSIGTLKHLQLLDLEGTPISKLPESLCNLLNLQVLDVTNCQHLGALPDNMSALINLRHLYDYDEIRAHATGIRGLGKLTALQELNFDCKRQKMKELADMDMLRELTISSLGEVKSKEEASESRLDKKEDLDKLEMEWSTVDRNPELDEVVLQSLKPPSNTRQLTIWNYGGIRSPGWMDDNLLLSSSLLERVELHRCTNWEVLPPLGQLPCLKFLTIQEMNKVRRVEPRFMGCRYTEGGVVEVPGFPLLQELEFRDMEEWEEWEAPQLQYQYGINDGEDDRRQKQPPQQKQPPPHPQQQIMFLPCLRELRIYRCPKLRQLPPLPPTLVTVIICNVGLTHLPGWLPSSSISPSSSSSPALSDLSIDRCPNLTSLNDGLLRHPDLQKLRRLEIQRCENLCSLPPNLSCLSSLESLTVDGCPEIRSLPAAGLPKSLRKLGIYKCPALGERCKEEPLISRIPDLHIR